MVPHARHEELIAVVMAAGVCRWAMMVNAKRNAPINPLSSLIKHVATPIYAGLTCAGLHALNPTVLKIFVADTSTILIPSTTRSAATDSPGFLERAAVRAY